MHTISTGALAGPVHQMHTLSGVASANVVQFSEEEEAKFMKRYENGYDLLHDSRYNQWLSLRYPKSGEGNPLALKLNYSTSNDSGSDVSNHGGCDDSFFTSTNLYPGKVQSTILEYITIHMHVHTVT